MRGPDDHSSGLSSYLSPERRVRPDHPPSGLSPTVGLMRKLRPRGGEPVDWMVTFYRDRAPPGALAHPWSRWLVIALDSRARTTVQA